MNSEHPNIKHTRRYHPQASKRKGLTSDFAKPEAALETQETTARTARSGHGLTGQGQRLNTFSETVA